MAVHVAQLDIAGRRMLAGWNTPQALP